MGVTLSDEQSVYVLELSAAAWQRIRKLDPTDANAGLAIASVLCDENGSLLFDPENKDDVKACGDLPLADTNLIIRAVMEKANAKTKSDELKNSEASPSIALASV
jgi:hypothetical protein